MSTKKVAIVTGAAQGIGAGIVKEMLNDSYLIYAVDKNEIQQQADLLIRSPDKPYGVNESIESFNASTCTLAVY